MKRIVFVLAFLACACVASAQSISFPFHVEWQTPAGPNLTTTGSYAVQFDGGATTAVPTTPDPSCSCYRSPTYVLTDVQAHKVSIVALPPAGAIAVPGPPLDVPVFVGVTGMPSNVRVVPGS